MPAIAPTKTNLLKTRQELQFARLGHELLDQKRNILVLELLNLVDQAVDLQEQVHSELSRAYLTLEQAVMRMGKLKVAALSSAINISTEINLKQRRVMGVRLPVVETSFSEHPPYFSPASTSFWIDASVEEFKKALRLMGRLAELKVSIIRLAAEVRKTIRKVNALEKIAIPELERVVGFIQNRLEENEREMFNLMKMVKSRLEGRQSSGRSD